MFDLHKKTLLTFLLPYLKQKQSEFIIVNSFGGLVLEKLKKFLEQGKMLRGSLVLQSFLFFQDKIEEDAVRIGAALELMHASLIIHDDIMDQSYLRRGDLSIFSQFEEFAKTKEISNARHFGEGMGICIGDLGFFLAQEVLSGIRSAHRDEIHALYAKELQHVALAQMQDLYPGEGLTELTKDEILALYKYKTGRYTFSLPFVLGALLAMQPKKILETLASFGESLGILFQIKDDELDIFGDKKITGKAIGSDIAENKKTLFRLFLFEKATANEKQKLAAIFGNSSVSIADINFVKDSIKKLGVLEAIKKITNLLESNVNKDINTLHFSKQKERILLELVAFSAKRVK